MLLGHLHQKSSDIGKSEREELHEVSTSYYLDKTSGYLT